MEWKQSVVKRRPILLIALFIVCCMSPVHAWRSSLYPEDWTPEFKDSSGRFLHDFSYAGYHQGELSIPDNPPGAVYTVTSAPYSADPTGVNDSTAAIQQAIDDAGAAGGGIVFFPAGTYAISPNGREECLRLSKRGVVLRGAGVGQTFLLNTEREMRYKYVIRIKPNTGDWHLPLSGTEISAATDFSAPTNQLSLAHVNGLNVGDLIILRTDSTQEFGEDLSMGTKWITRPGLTFSRSITGIDSNTDSISIDVPTRFIQKVRDNARVYKVDPHLKECGVEDLSIGMLQNLSTGFGASDYTKVGTAAYEVHQCRMIHLEHAENCWVQRVGTYRPSENASDVHILSHGISVYESRSVTIRDCTVERPQYRGGGGNGYGFTLRGNDCLVEHCTAIRCRHAYDYMAMCCSGNVFSRCRGIDSSLMSDFHMFFAVVNLFDAMELDNDALDAQYRPFSDPEHGHPTTESVFWNTHRDGYGVVKDSNGNICDGAVYSGQWGNGYVIGTSGEYPKIYLTDRNDSEPTDLAEGEGIGDRLVPQSLYLDQRTRRLGTKVATRDVTELDRNAGTVTMNFSVISTGKVAATVGYCWGTSDGGTSMWEHVKQVGALVPGEYTDTLSGISEHAVYWVRAWSSNEYGLAWADEVRSFSFSSQSEKMHEEYFDADLSGWQIEKQPDSAATIIDGKLDIDAGTGCVAWFKPKLLGAFEIAFQVVMMDAGGANDSVSDLSFLVMASDPTAPDTVFNDARGGVASSYYDLQLYQFGFGENDNTATRLRRYPGDGTAPLLSEHDLNNIDYLLTANHPINFRIRLEDGRIRCFRNEELVYDVEDTAPFAEGWFAFQASNSHFRVDNFSIMRLGGLPIVQANDATVSAATQTATLSASLLAGEEADLIFVWGLTDKGSNLSHWAERQTVPDCSEGLTDVSVSNLQEEQVYTFRCMASNAFGTAWTEPLSFSTRVFIEKTIVEDDFSTVGDFTGNALMPDVGPVGAAWMGRKTSSSGTMTCSVTSDGRARFGANWATGRGGSAALSIDAGSYAYLKLEADLVDLDGGSCALLGFNAPQAEYAKLWDSKPVDSVYLVFDLDDSADGSGQLRYAGLWSGSSELTDFTAVAALGSSSVSEYEGHRWALIVDRNGTASVSRDGVKVVDGVKIGDWVDLDIALNSIVISGMYNDWEGSSNRYVDFDNLMVVGGLSRPGSVSFDIHFVGHKVDVQVYDMADYVTNVLQYSTNLVDGSWSNIMEFTGVNSTNWMHEPDHPNGYYRVKTSW